MRSRADVCVYEPFSQGSVVISHQRTKNREPKVTVSLLLDQHVMAVYWLWESGEGQQMFHRYSVGGTYRGQGAILLNQHGPVSARQVSISNTDFSPSQTDQRVATGSRPR